MKQSPSQNFENHIRYDQFAIGLALVTLAVLVLAVAGIVWPAASHAAVVLLAALLIATQLKARIYGLTVQDRVIRLEMQVRLERILPDDLRVQARSLDKGHLVALRFASDAELPDLVRRTLAGAFKTPTDIKRAVTDWQADTLRV